MREQEKGQIGLKLEDYQATVPEKTGRIPKLDEKGKLDLVPGQEGWAETVEVAKNAWEETAAFFEKKGNIFAYDYTMPASEPTFFTARSLHCRAKAIELIKAKSEHITPGTLDACMENLLRQGFALAQEERNGKMATNNG